MEDAPPLAATPTSVQMALETFGGIAHRAYNELDKVDWVTEDLTTQTPTVFMAPSEKKGTRIDVLYKAVPDAENSR